MNRNVLNWVASAVPDARHALILTHNISFLFVEGVLLPKLRAAGDPRVTILADAGCAAGSWRQDQPLISRLGIRYRVVPVDLGPWRRFHPKAVLLAGEDRAALAIGSGNLTHGGMGANREAWVFGTTDDDGAPRISALREYLATVLEQLPLVEPVRDSVNAIFDPEQRWSRELPMPAGLAGAPSAVPILDQLASAAGEVTRVTVLTPYFDDKAEALKEIARRFRVPVDVLLQSDNAGLWAQAAKNLPPEVSLKSVEELSAKGSFIHAKVLALHRTADTLIAIGSANCSKAALLSDQHAGNAELMAWSIEPVEKLNLLLGELQIKDEPPPLPAERPSDDWKDDALASLHVLAAHQAAERLEVAFSPVEGIAKLSLIADGEWPIREIDASAGLARADVPVRLRTIRLRAMFADGSFVESPDAWVDDETSLSSPATFRRVLGRFQEAAEAGFDQATRYEALVSVFGEYLRDPQARSRRFHRGRPELPPAPYDPAAVFDEGFGTGPVHLPASPSGSRASSSPLAWIEAIFGMHQEPCPPINRGPLSAPEEEPPTNEEVPDSEIIANARPADAKHSAAVARAVARVEKALLDPSFTSARSPELLASDVALAATLLVLGLTTGHLEVDTFRNVTRRLWTHLFFGQGGQPGAVLVRAQSGHPSFIAEFATPRLSAALSLWCTTEWMATDGAAAWFRLSAASLQGRYPFLFAAAQPDAILAGLGECGALLPANEQVACVRTWREVVRAGKVLELLCTSLKSGSREAFQRVTRNGWLDPAQLVWAGCSLAFPTARTLIFGEWGCRRRIQQADV